MWKLLLQADDEHAEAVGDAAADDGDGEHRGAHEPAPQVRPRRGDERPSRGRQRPPGRRQRRRHHGDSAATRHRRSTRVYVTLPQVTKCLAWAETKLTDSQLEHRSHHIN